MNDEKKVSICFDDNSKIRVLDPEKVATAHGLESQQFRSKPQPDPNQNPTPTV